MTTRCSSDQGLFDVAEVDREKADSVDVRNPGANPRDVVKVHVDEIGIAGLAILGPHSSAYSGNPKPNSEAAPGYHSVGRSLLGNHGRIGRALDIRLAVGALPEMLRTLHRVCQCLDQGRIESSRYSPSDLLRIIDSAVTYLGLCLTCYYSVLLQGPINGGLLLESLEGI